MQSGAAHRSRNPKRCGTPHSKSKAVRHTALSFLVNNVGPVSFVLFEFPSFLLDEFGGDGTGFSATSKSGVGSLGAVGRRGKE
jgi:hypothetical protein